MPLVPSIVRAQRQARRDVLMRLLLVLAVLVAAEVIIGLVTGNWLLIPDALIWFVEYTLGLRPE